MEHIRLVSPGSSCWNQDCNKNHRSAHAPAAPAPTGAASGGGSHSFTSRSSSNGDGAELTRALRCFVLAVGPDDVGKLVKAPLKPRAASLVE
jgi:hypothetical protein